MINSNNTSNTYDKSTLDAKFEAINDKLLELKLSLSSRVESMQHKKDIAEAINKMQSSIPEYYITYEELRAYLKDYVTEDTLDKVFKVDTDPVTIIDNGQINLDFIDKKLSITSTPPYIAPTALISVTPRMIEYGESNPIVTLNVTVSDSDKIKKLTVSGGTLVNENITSSKTVLDTANNTRSTTYTLTYTNDLNQIKYTNCSTEIGKRVLYGIIQPTTHTFSSIDNLKNYQGSYILTNSNPSSITITQEQYQYGWIATPWKIKSFADSSINLVGGWETNEDGTLKYTQYDSPYGDGNPYYVYRTTNSGLGTIKWNITNN